MITGLLRITDHDDGGDFVRLSDLDKWMTGGGLNHVLPFIRDTAADKAASQREGEYYMSDLTDAYQSAAKTMSDAQGAYKKILDEFRSTIRNDLAAIASSVSRLQAEHAKLAASTRNTISVLTSVDMTQAIANAERLAVALTAISELKSHNITFAVLDKKPPS